MIYDEEGSKERNGSHDKKIALVKGSMSRRVWPLIYKNKYEIYLVNYYHYIII